MAHQPDDLADRVQQLERAVTALERRLADVEARAEAPAGRPDSDQASGPESEETYTPVIGGPTAGALTLIGRTSVVLGGAFLLRALTESGSVPVAVGVSIGFVYSLVWLAAAYRADERHRASAFFHGLASIIIALPLLFEAVARFQSYGTWTSAVLFGLFASAGLLVSSRQRLHSLAVLVLLGTLVDISALAIATADPVPYALLAAILGPVTAALAEPRGSSWLRWPVAFVANLLVLALVLRGMGPSPLAPAGQTLLVVCTFSAAYTWLIVHGLLGRIQPPGVFDVLQGLALVLIGLIGIPAIAATVSPAVGVGLGLMVLLSGAAAYAIGLGLSTDRPYRMPTVHFFTSAAVAIVLVGAASLMQGVTLTMWFAGMAFVFSWVGARRLQPTFLLHGSVYVIASAMTLGLVGSLGLAWLLPFDTWPALAPLLWLVAAAAALGVLGPRLAAGDLGGYLTVVARTTNATVFTAVAATWLLITLGPWLAGLPEAGSLAALRSAVLAVTAVCAAAAGRANRSRAFGRLAYPVLAIGAVKLVVEDFWRSGPLMIFVALACFGVALILTTRLRGRT